ncbi:YT521-B-like domain-containing protein [Mycena polygramma]|nr:YT521-B-like domain-containing protein [Mycena polygramma]
MVSPKISLPSIADAPYDTTLTPRPSLRQLVGGNKNDRIDRTTDSPPVYAFTPAPADNEASLKAHSRAGDPYMAGHGRGGTDQARSGASSSSTRRQPPSQASQSQQQQRRQTPGYHPPLYATASVQYPPPRQGYSGQYMMSPQPPHNMAHTPPLGAPFQYPAFHVPIPVSEQPQSIHAGYPTLAGYSHAHSQYAASDPPPYASPAAQGALPSPQQPSPVFSPSFRYPSPLSPVGAYPAYPQHQAPFSPPPTLYSHHQSHQHTQYPPAQYAPYAHSPGVEGDGGGGGGTWWYVPPQPAQHTPQYEAGPGTYQFFLQQPPPSGAPLDPGGGSSEYRSHPASPTFLRPGTPSSSAASPAQSTSGVGRGERPIVRRAYHPNPPAHRSEWVMWAGNVPSDAGHDELWRFFTQRPDDAAGSTSTSAASSVSGGSSSNGDAGSGEGGSGVLSIFLISRSSCAFVNYETEAHLQAAIGRFNGVPLRPVDPRCARLVCRVRRKDDDLRAGVGGQRGMGMHSRWVKAKVGKARDDGDASVSSNSRSASDSGHSNELNMSALSIAGSDDDAPVRPPPRPYAAGSNSSGSHASTNSSLLRTHFPQRFFILKSLTREDLDLSVQTGVWATQKHNEGILDRAFRTSKDVFLVFSVNKSGEFYGYARMAGPVGHGDGGRVTWARRDSNASAGGAQVALASSPVAHDASAVHAAPNQQNPQQVLSMDRLVDASPGTFPTPDGLAEPDASTPPERRAAHGAQSAPAELGHPHKVISANPEAHKGFSFDERHLEPVSSARRESSIELDASAPFRAQRPGATEPGSASGPALGSVEEEPSTGEREREGAAAREEGWGENFQLQWLCTERLPFQRTRHIRNPWNHDREIKVSRDGTELEPTVGQALLEEWRLFLASAEGAALQKTPMAEQPPSVTPAGAQRAGRGGPAARS